MSRRIAVLASGGGSNLQAILDYFAAPGGAKAGSIVLVASDKPSCGALEKARAGGVPAVSCAPTALGTVLEQHDVELVALAGYLRFVPEEITARFAGRIVNIHPALLPAFGGAGMYGRKVHEAVLRSGARVSGATVHFVNEQYDRGPIVAQWPVPVLDGDTPTILSARVLAVEHLWYPRALAAIAADRISLDSTGVVRPTRDREAVIDAMDAWLSSPS
jgi:formyltetrahydrofolate-dependent phosphoribosylglycinamide formyltransferase